MDRKALEYTKMHYDRHSRQEVNQKEALRERAQGPSAPLKRFHNQIKRKLIDRFATGVERLLDLACGRGGDILKWIDANIGYVKGLDLSPGEIQEAKSRFENIRKERKNTFKTVCEFADTSALGIETWKEPQPFDVVTCMFAIHYFFVSEPALQQFMYNVSSNLKIGGYFIGTVPDGKKIMECVRYDRKYNTPMLKVEAHWKGMPAPFGSPYICAIGDTVTGAEAGTQGSFEYLVYEKVLVGVAKQFGLEPVLEYDDPELDDLFMPLNVNNPNVKPPIVLRHFNPQFQPDPRLMHQGQTYADQLRSLTWASQLFAAFVFRKVREPPSIQQKNVMDNSNIATTSKRPRDEAGEGNRGQSHSKQEVQEGDAVQQQGEVPAAKKVKGDQNDDTASEQHVNIGNAAIGDTEPKTDDAIAT